MRIELIPIVLFPWVLAAQTPIVATIPYFWTDNSGVNHAIPIQAVAADPMGNIYVTGQTSGAIPLVNAIQPQLGGGDCSPEPTHVFAACPNLFVAKFDPSGTRLIYSTYLGSNQSDYAAGIAADAQGNAYIAGTTTPAGFYPQPPQGGNAFVKKLSPDGPQLIYTRYIGGNSSASGIAVDAMGDAYIDGYNVGLNFPSVHPLPLQPSIKSLFVTNDSGRTWRTLNNGLDASVSSLAIDPTRPSILYAGTSNGLYQSSDGGITWKRLLPQAATVSSVVVDPKQPSVIYAISPGDRLWRSADAGTSWTDLSGNFPPASFPGPTEPIGAFTIDPTDSNTLWAIVIPNRFSSVIKSTDAGAHWQAVYTFPPDIFQSATLVGMKLLIDPKNTSRIYACCIHDPTAGTGGIYRSDDGGKSWVQGALGPQGPFGITSPWLDPADSTTLYGDWYVGLQRSTDGGMSWTAVALPTDPNGSGYEPGGLALDASGAIYLLNDNGFLLRSVDGAATWSRINGPWTPQASILAIDPVNQSTWYVSSGAGILTPRHGFAAKLDPSGNIQWATLLGGSSDDDAKAIAVDAAGDVYLTGQTYSADFPTLNAFQPALGRNGYYAAANAFISKIGADGSQLLYSSFLGGTGRDSGNAVAVDAAGNAYVAGGTQSPDFPTLNPLRPEIVSPQAASFLAKVDPSGGKLINSTLLTAGPGYPAYEQANAIALDSRGRVLVGGLTGDFTLPLVNAVQPTFGIGSNFVVRLTPTTDAMDFSTYWHQDINTLAAVPGGGLLVAGSDGISRFDFQPPTVQPGIPKIFSLNNGASFIPGDNLAPGEIVTIFGDQLAPAPQAAGPAALPRSMQDVSVSVGGVNAPLFYVSPTQINFQVPFELPLGPAVLTVQSGPQSSDARPVNMIASAPGIFSASGDPRGTPVVTHASDFSLVTAQNPARAGEFLAAFCTGLGATDPPATTGDPARAAAAIKANIIAVFGSGADLFISYAGLAPGWVGLYQINFQVNASPGQTTLWFETSEGPTNQVPVWIR